MITLFSILLGLYLTKQFPLSLRLQFKIKRYFGTNRAKPFDCTACSAFWISVTALCFAYFNCGLWWPGWGAAVLTTVSSYTGGSFIEAVWRKI